MDCEESREILRGYLSRRLRIVLSDGRVVDGDCEEFLCQADVETRDASPGCVPQKANIRTLALAIVPGQHIQSIAVAKLPNPEDKRPTDTTVVKDYSSQEENCSVTADTHVT